MKDGHFFIRLESARGLAALTVVAMHVMSWFSPLDESGAGAVILRHVFNGQGAVNFFFVLSGFVLGASISRCLASRSPVVRFVTARFFRLYPAVIATVLVYSAIAYLSEPSGFITIEKIVKNAMLLDVSLNPLMWSLQIEVVAIPVIILLGYAEFKFGLVPLALATIALFGMMFTRHWFIGGLLLSPLFGFALGMMTRSAMRIVANLKTPVVAVLFFLAFAAFEITRIFLPPSAAGYRWITIVECVSSAILIAAIAFSFPKSFAFLDHKIFRFYGRISYSLYLVHPMILVGLRFFIKGPLSVAECVLLILVVIAFSTVLASMVWAVVEKPGIALGRTCLDGFRLRKRQPELVSETMHERGLI